MTRLAPRRFSLSACWLVAIVMSWLAWRGAQRRAPFVPTDLSTWKGDWTHAMSCVVEQAGTLPCEGLSKFPLGYLANAGLYGLSPEHGSRLLAIANVAALALPLLVLAFVEGLRAVHRMGWPYVLAIALSPLPMFYIFTGALEVQAGVFCGLYVGAFSRLLASPLLDAGKRTSLTIVVSGLLFPLYKDTVAPLVGVAIAIALIWHRSMLWNHARTPEGRRRLLRAALLAGVSVLLGQLLDMAYSWFKYGVPLPLAYINEARLTAPSYGKSIEFLAGVLFSPNGGVLVFWMLPFFVAVGGWWATGAHPIRTAVIAAAAVAGVSCLALARWWAPFGWDGWGDRLMVSAMVAALVALLLCVRPADVITMPALHVVSRVMFMVLLACSAYYVTMPYFVPKSQPLRDSLWSGSACMHMRGLLSTDAVVQGLPFWKGDAYYACARERMLYVPHPDTSNAVR